MAHIFEDKKKIVSRIRRIKGQLEAVERILDEEKDCFNLDPYIVRTHLHG